MNIYVGNLSFEATEDELRAAFEEFGKVASVSILQDKLSGRPRGFGFVEMPASEEAKAAISGLNGREIKGRSLKVNEALPKTDRDGGGGGGREHRGGGGGRRF